MDVKNKYRPVIGLEVHAQLLTHSKIFSGDSTTYGAEPNTQVSVITLAHPGTLPKLNKKAFEYAIRMGLACGSEITRFNIFDRKSYFYPDLPKGYQVTQDRTPICKGGWVEIKTSAGERKKIALNRIHLEEDAGKSIHTEAADYTAVDFNRTGVPLIEIVTEPCLHTSEEAYLFLTEIRKLVRYLEICDGNMEEGSLRCDANISVMLAGARELGKKVEVKNMNSIRYVQRAIDIEIERQVALMERGETVVSETRTFQPAAGTTMSMRVKEELNDYRYFPDPDLSPVIISEDWLEQIRRSMAVLPQALEQQFIADYGLSEYDAHVLTDSKDIALFFMDLCRHTGNYKAAANWILGPVKSYLNEVTLAAHEFPVSVEKLAEIIAWIDAGKLNFSSASQRLFPVLLKRPEESIGALAKALDLVQESDTERLRSVIEQVLEELPQKVKEYRSGKTGILGMFMGEVMKRTQGKADPKVANKLLLEKLNTL